MCILTRQKLSIDYNEDLTVSEASSVASEMGLESEQREILQDHAD